MSANAAIVTLMPHTTTTERDDLLAALAAARAALLRSLDGLDDEQLAQRPTVSSLCLGGLVKHVASMEEVWLRFAVEGPSSMDHPLPEGATWDDITTGAVAPPRWMVEHEAEFAMRPGDTKASILERYRRVAESTARIVASLPDLSTTHPLPVAPWHEPGATRSARGVLLVLIHETGQHAGHADLLRETLDKAS